MQLTERKQQKLASSIVEIQTLMSHELTELNSLILAEMTSEIAMINEIIEHIISSGGKRLRPLVLLLFAKAFQFSTDNEHIELAAIIEFIHTATLLHDDVIDGSKQRRNEPTANAVWGNQASVLAGDFLYSRAFQILARRDNLPVMRLLANATNLISEGEVLQLTLIGNSDISEKDYYKVIHCKTAELYSVASQIGAMLTQTEDTILNNASKFGLHLGLAFQMIDDLLDYTADTELSGKNLGDDLAEGKVTLPLIYTLQKGTPKQKQLIQNAIETGGRSSIAEVISAIRDSRGIEYTFNAAKNEAKIAQNCLKQIPKNIYSDALSEICNFVLLREY